MSSNESSLSIGCKWASIALCIPGVIFALWAAWQIPREREYYALQKQLGQVCDGIGNPASPAYMGSEVHPIFFADHINWNREQPKGWQPTHFEDVQLVACVEYDEVAIQTCNYSNGPDITRFRKIVRVTVYAARTGQKVAEASFQGGDPRKCGSSEPVNLEALRNGSPVKFDQIRGWLGEIVNRDVVAH